MKVTCFGPRGSIPSPSRKGFSTIEYGGNTSCYYVEAGPFRIILDLGSGALVLGDDLFKSGNGFNREFITLLSHFHWDHIQGGPFNGPMFIKSNKFHFHGFAPVGFESEKPFNEIVKRVIASQQEAPNFPISHDQMPSDKEYTTHHFTTSETFKYFCDENGKYVLNATEILGLPSETLPQDIKMNPSRWIEITTVPLVHPNGCIGYRISYMGKTMLYATDSEPLLFLNKEIIKNGKDSDLMILDGQYTAQQLSGMTQNWGHGNPENCVDHAIAANTKILAIHHHDPRHNDDTLMKMENLAIEYSRDRGYTGIVEFAREGKVWML